jgi:hypothetical protein
MKTTENSGISRFIAENVTQRAPDPDTTRNQEAWGVQLIVREIFRRNHRNNHFLTLNLSSLLSDRSNTQQKQPDVST